MGFFQRLKQGLTKTRGGLTKKVDELVVSGRPIDDDFYDELTDILILADVGVSATEEIIEKLKARVKEKGVRDTSACRELLKEIIIEEMNIPRPKLQWPLVMFVVGVNGVGKTTSIGKIALMLRRQGKKVMLCGADTFRAAAIEQLAVWGERASVPMISQAEGADPAAVVFDACAAAKKQGIDVLIVDTAGRLHNKKNLIDELSKINRVISREYPEAHRETLLVLDAVTGQNGLSQAREFTKAADVNGIVLTKLDGTAKGGIVLAIRSSLGIPVKLIGVGEGPEDLQSFSGRDFVNAMFEE